MDCPICFHNNVECVIYNDCCNYKLCRDCVQKVNKCPICRIEKYYTLSLNHKYYTVSIYTTDNKIGCNLIFKISHLSDDSSGVTNIIKRIHDTIDSYSFLIENFKEVIDFSIDIFYYNGYDINEFVHNFLKSVSKFIQQYNEEFVNKYLKLHQSKNQEKIVNLIEENSKEREMKKLQKKYRFKR
jgi:hypothetical protein